MSSGPGRRLSGCVSPSSTGEKVVVGRTNVDGRAKCGEYLFQYKTSSNKPSDTQAIGEGIALSGPKPAGHLLSRLAAPLKAALTRSERNDEALVALVSSLASRPESALRDEVCALVEALAAGRPVLAITAWLVVVHAPPGSDRRTASLLDRATAAIHDLSSTTATHSSPVVWHTINALRRRLAALPDPERQLPGGRVADLATLLLSPVLDPEGGLLLPEDIKDAAHVILAAAGQAARLIPLAMPDAEGGAHSNNPLIERMGATVQALTAETSPLQPKAEEVLWLSSVLANAAAKLQRRSLGAACCLLRSALDAAAGAARTRASPEMALTLTRRALECVALHAQKSESSRTEADAEALFQVLERWSGALGPCWGPAAASTLPDQSTEVALVEHALAALPPEKPAGAFVLDALRSVSSAADGFPRAARLALLVLAAAGVPSDAKQAALCWLLDERPETGASAADRARWLLRAGRCLLAAGAADVPRGRLSGTSFQKLIRSKLSLRKTEVRLLLQLF